VSGMETASPRQSAAPLVSIRKLSKTYPSGVTALRNINLDVQPGEFLVVIGLSGSGKSTLLRSINRLLTPSEGEVLFDGRRIDNLSDREARSIRRQIGMVFQNFNLIGRHSVRRNVLAGRLGHMNVLSSLLGRFSRADEELAAKCLDLVGLSEKIRVRADQLSGGQQQRVAIARALCQEPKLILADEPVASLDPATAHTILDYLRRANRELGTTVICNLHFLSLVREYATRVVALRAGEIVFTGSPAQIDKDWFKKIYGEDARDIHVG
jgi:phosphonate transport system ATP-binding protein